VIEKVTGKKYKGIDGCEIEDSLSVEEMLSISVNGKPYTITMRSPGNEKALVRGILLTEDIYSDREKHPNFVVRNKNHLGYITEVNAVIDKQLVEKGIETKRNLLSVTSCGMCGMQEMDLALGEPHQDASKLEAALVEIMFASMQEAQKTFEKSGGSHASAAFTLEGKLLSIQEDIGRHNAVDKVIGDLLLQGILDHAKVILVSGRLSYEIVRKAFKARIPFLAAVSAPSSMAVRIAQESGICLMAFCRGKQFTVYTQREKIV
jgi:FdhD protein